MAPRQGVCSQTEDQPESWHPHNRTAERPRAPQLETRRPWRYTVGLMAFVFFEVLYNDEEVSALRLQLAGPIVLTGWLLKV